MKGSEPPPSGNKPSGMGATFHRINPFSTLLGRFLGQSHAILTLVVLYWVPVPRFQEQLHLQNTCYGQGTRILVSPPYEETEAQGCLITFYPYPKYS